jgi:hypothetical protein
MPANITLKTLVGDVSTDTGASDSSLRGAISAPAVTLTGCASDQTAVARLMARLHDVDGVTRVSLSKSDDTTTQAPQQSGNSSALEQRNAAPCGTGVHPSFEVVAFFEHASAAVSAPPAGSSAATAAASATPTPTPTATATPSGSSASNQGATP